MEFLAQRSPVTKFIRNSLQLWYSSQWDKHNASRVFYGCGLPQFVVLRQIARKRALEGARQTDETGELLHFIEPFESMVQNIIKVGAELQDFYQTDSVYSALREFQTPGFVNPFQEEHIYILAKEVQKRQQDHHSDMPSISEETHNRIVDSMLKLAHIDLVDRVELLKTEAPACLGYPMGGIDKGVKLGLSYNPDEPLKTLFNIWHEIGHACYRQFIPMGHMVAGRAMDESIAFMFEYHIGYGDDFLQFLLDSGLKKCGYDMNLLQSALREVNRDTRRIETNPLRHPIDIYIHSCFEEMTVNEEEEDVPPDALFAKVLEPFRDIFPDDYSFYQDAHTRGGVFGDREAYNAGYAGAFQIGKLMDVTMDNMVEKVRYIAKSGHENFATAIKDLTKAELCTDYYMQWISNIYNVSMAMQHQPKQPENNPAMP